MGRPTLKEEWEAVQLDTADLLTAIVVQDYSTVKRCLGEIAGNMTDLAMASEVDLSGVIS